MKIATRVAVAGNRVVRAVEVGPVARPHRPRPKLGLQDVAREDGMVAVELGIDKVLDDAARTRDIRDIAV